MKNVKSLLAILLCAAFLFTAAACGEQTDPTDPTATGGSVASGTTRSARTGVEEGTTSVVTGGGTTSIVTGGGTTSVISGGGTTSIVTGGGTTSVVTGGGDGKVTGGPGGKTTQTTSGGGGQSGGDFIKSLSGLTINIHEMRSEKMERGTTTGDRYFATLSKIAKKYNCSINYIATPKSDLQTSILSGKPEANVLSIQDYVFPAWLNAGVCANLNSAMKQAGVTFKEAWYDQDIRKFCNWNGQQLCWCADIREPYMITYNKRLIQEAKLTDPYQMYEKGKWTYDTFTTYLNKLVKKSSDGTVIGYALTNSTDVAAMTHIIVNNGTSLVKISGKSLTSNLGDSKINQALEYFKKWSGIKGAISAAGSDWTGAAVAFAEGKAAMTLFTKYVFSVINEKSMTDAVGVVPFPQGPSFKKSEGTVALQIFPTFIAKTDEKDAGKILYVMNEIYKARYANRDQDFFDDYRSLIRDEKAYNTYKNFSLDQKKSTLKYDYLAGIMWPPAPQAIFNLATAVVGNSVSNAVNTNKKAFQTATSDVWGDQQFTGF